MDGQKIAKDQPFDLKTQVKRVAIVGVRSNQQPKL